EAVRIGDARRAGAAQTPFAENPGAVSGLLEQACHGDVRRLEVHVLLVAAYAGVAGVFARHQRATRWSADSVAGVDLSEAHPFGRQAVDVRRLNHLLPEAAEVAIAQVVGQAENDVGFRAGALRAQHGASQASQKFSSAHLCDSFSDLQ